MQDRNFTIKVSDFLKSNTITDTILFKDKFSTKLPDLVSWITTVIHLQKWDDSTIFAHLKDICYSLIYLCDGCWTRLIKNNTIQDLTISFYADYPLSECQEFEASFSSKDWCIDLENILFEEISLRMPINTLCTSCQTMSNSLTIDKPRTTWVLRK